VGEVRAPTTLISARLLEDVERGVVRAIGVSIDEKRTGKPEGWRARSPGRID
jgi:hypothetical protein